MPKLRLIESTWGKFIPVTSERTGLYRILRATWVYDLVQKFLGSRRGSEIFLEDFLRPFAGARILDIGAGTGLVVPHLGSVSYLGIEPNVAYVDEFNRRFKTDRVKMVVGTTSSIAVDPASFDIVLISAVLHHVSDDVATSILDFAASALAEDGRIVLLDPVLHSGQSLLSRQLVKRDRGKFVRGEDHYRSLFSGVGLSATFTVRTDLMRFPYSHIITTVTHK